MAKITPARMTAALDGEFVVFLIGMRVNKPWKLHKWLPVARAMAPMIRVLATRDDLGLLGYHLWLGPTGPLTVQYWRSAEHLERFARDSTLPHHEAWRRFNHRVGTRGDVGIWHETYLVRSGAYESVYLNMPRFGLARAGIQLPVAARGDTAAARLRTGAATAGVSDRTGDARPGGAPALVIPGGALGPRRPPSAPSASRPLGNVPSKS